MSQQFKEVNLRSIIEPLLLAVQNKLNPNQPVSDADVNRFLNQHVFDEDDGWTTGGENFYPDEAEATRSFAGVRYEIGVLGEHAVASGHELKQIDLRTVIKPLLLAVQNKLNPGQEIIDVNIARFVDLRVFN